MHAFMNFRMRRRDRYECDIHILCPWTVSTTCFALVKINKAEFTKSASTMVCKILLWSHLQSIGILTALVFFSVLAKLRSITHSHVGVFIEICIQTPL